MLMQVFEYFLNNVKVLKRTLKGPGYRTCLPTLFSLGPSEVVACKQTLSTSIGLGNTRTDTRTDLGEVLSTLCDITKVLISRTVVPHALCFVKLEQAEQSKYWFSHFWALIETTS